MRINPVTISACNSYIPVNKKSQQSDAAFSSAERMKSVVYPRRYLPEYYPVTDSKKKTFDSFTGMRDKNYLLEVVKSAMSDVNRNNRNFSIAMFDMDNFKSVNELLGYKTGDDFIKHISKKISLVAKENSIGAYRFGGEEFVLVFANQQRKQQDAIVEGIISSVNSDEYIKSKASEYRKNADLKLQEYYDMHSKIEQLIPLKTKRDIFHDLRNNLSTPEAKNDPYLLKSIQESDVEIRDLYLSLLDERLAADDEDERTKELLKNIRAEFAQKGKIAEDEEKELDEYLFSVYDKTFEIHQIKKWVSDFDANGGFSITGGVVNYTPESMRNKKPIDIINEAGEILKKGKNIRKGQGYRSTVKN